MSSIVSLLHRYLRSSDTVIDIGAKNGVPRTLPAAEIVGPHGRVFALELDRARYNRLRINAALSRWSNVRALHLTASASTELSDADAPVYRLDELIEIPAIGQVDFVIIDAPGRELEILSGMGALVSTYSAPGLLFRRREGEQAEEINRLTDLLAAADYDLAHFESALVALSPRMLHRKYGPAKSLFPTFRAWGRDGRSEPNAAASA